MKLFAQLLEQVADERNITLASCLLKAQLLASQIESPAFSQWVDLELAGYSDAQQAAIPPYRKIAVPVMGEYAEVMGQRRESRLIRTESLPKEIRAVIERVSLIGNVGELEAKGRITDGVFKRQIETAFVRMMNQRRATCPMGWQLEFAHNIITPADFQGVVAAIRHRLLAFLIKLKSEFPQLMAEGTDTPSVPTDAADRLVVQTIYDGCNFFTEDNSMSKAELNVGGNVAVVGDFVIADRIRDSFNKVSGMAPADVKELLQQLADALAEAGKDLPPEVAKQAVEDYETLAKEAAKPQPRKPFLKAAGGALIETFKFAGPVISLVAAILKLYGA